MASGPDDRTADEGRARDTSDTREPVPTEGYRERVEEKDTEQRTPIERGGRVGGFRSVQEEYRRFVERIWGAVLDLEPPEGLEPAGSEADAGQPGEPGEPMEEDFVEYLIRQLPPEEILIGPPVEQAQGESVLPTGTLQGDVNLVAAQAGFLAAQVRGDTEALRRLLLQTIAPTITRLEEAGEGTPERRLDAVIHVLAARPPAECTRMLREFVAGLRGYLGRQEKNDRRSGFYQTFGALGDLLNGPDEQACKLQAGFYYHEVASEIYLRWEDEGFAQSEIYERLRNAMHNMATQIEVSLSRRQAEGSGDEGHAEDAPPAARARSRRARQLHQTVTGLRRVAAAMEIVRSDLDSPQARYCADLFRQAWIGRSPAGRQSGALAWVRYARLADYLMLVPGTWRGVEGCEWLQIAYMEALAGLVRLTDPESHSRVGAAFFNAGVSLLRLEESSQTNYVLARCLLNALGLWWAVHLCSEGLLEALVEYDALDCAVNLLGAGHELDPDPQERSDWSRLAGMIVGFERALPDKHVDFFRIRRSTQHLGGSIPPQGIPAGKSDIENATAVILRRLLARWDDLELREWPGEDPDVKTAGIVRETFRRLAPPDRRAKWLEGLTQPIERLMDYVLPPDTDPGEVFREVYRELAGKNLAGPEPAVHSGTGGMPSQRPGLELIGKGPFVAAGVISDRQWLDIAAEAVRPVERLGDHVQSYVRALRW